MTKISQRSAEAVMYSTVAPPLRSPELLLSRVEHTRGQSATVWGVTVCGWPGEGCCCALALLWWSSGDSCSAWAPPCRLSPSGSRSPSVWGFWSGRVVGMLLGGSEGKPEQILVFVDPQLGGKQNKNKQNNDFRCSTGSDH